MVLIRTGKDTSSLYNDKYSTYFWIGLGHLLLTSKWSY